MELRRLRYFVAAAEELSFRRAADRINLAQSALSRQIAALEEELGVDLFERRYTGARLTEAGRAFLGDATRILADVDRARETVASVAFGIGGRVRLAVCEDATTPTFATIIAAYRERFPNVALDLFEMPSAMQASALRRGDIDAGLLLPPVPGTGIQCYELWRENWLVVMQTGHRLERLSVIEIADLAHENFITAHPEFGPGCHHQTQEMFLSAGIAPPIVASAFHRLTMTMLVRSGAGVTLVPGAFAGSALAGISMRPLASGDHKMCVSVAYPDGDMQGTVAQFLRVASATAATVARG